MGCFFVGFFVFLRAWFFVFVLGGLRVFVVLGAFVDLGEIVTVWLFARLRVCVRFV